MIVERAYPNAARLSERFHISQRQAQRDVDCLRKKLGAPLAYSAERKGFYYTAPFTLPLAILSDNEIPYSDLTGAIMDAGAERVADVSLVQMEIPYTAVLEIPDKLAALELNHFIISKEGRNRYSCEFHSPEKFLSVIMTSPAVIRIVEPFWLRERLIRLANNALHNNAEAK